MLTDYSHLTESVGSRISNEQLKRMYTRYAFAAELCEGKDVLEVACGIGQGLGLMATKARSVTAGDYTQNLVDSAREHYGSRFDIRRFDAQEMPFEDGSFDAVLLYEAIYYLPDPGQFLKECRRVLRPSGLIIICTANKDWAGFARSPSSYGYFGAVELHRLLERAGFAPTIFGDCSVADGSLWSGMMSPIRRIVVSLGLMPDSLKAREKLKRLVFGRLREMPRELLEGAIEHVRPVQISHGLPNRNFKVLFAVGTLR